jgi:hypothetical protein
MEATKAAEAMHVVVEKAPQTVDNASETPESTGVGDVTQTLAADMTTLEKKSLVDKLNKSAAKERSDTMRKEFLMNAAGVCKRGLPSSTAVRRAMWARRVKIWGMVGMACGGKPNCNPQASSATVSTSSAPSMT